MGNSPKCPAGSFVYVAEGRILSFSFCVEPLTNEKDKEGEEKDLSAGGAQTPCLLCGL
jgi:hypothetical protein